MAKAIVNGNRSKGTINPNIYGHFSEHLGRCVYNGLYVGQDSDIPHVNGMRADVVEALKKMGIPLAGRHWAAGEPEENCEHQLGRCHRGQQLRHP